MVRVEIERKLGLDEVEPMEDDGTPPDCACCAWAEGRELRDKGRSLSSSVLELAWPMFEAVGETRRAVWEALLVVAAQAWNSAVLLKRDGAGARHPGGLIVELVNPGGGMIKFDASTAIAAMVDRKLELFPGDDRTVEVVHLSERGDLWCQPGRQTGEQTEKRR